MTISIIGSIWLCSCRTQYIPAESVRIEYKDRIVKDSSVIKEITNIHDSVRYHDSIVQVVDENGNVLRTEVYKWRDRFRESNYLLNQLQAKYDSLSLVKQDSAQVPYPVERELTSWQTIKQEIGGIAIGVIIALCFIIVWLAYKNRRK